MYSNSTTIKYLRLSNISASAPAGMANTQMGKEPAACTSATTKGPGLRPVISQPEAALYIQPPTLETTVAIQITAKARCRNGALKESRVPELAPALLIRAAVVKSDWAGTLHSSIRSWKVRSRRVR